MSSDSHAVPVRRLCSRSFFYLYNIMVMEVDTTPSSPTLMTSVVVAPEGEERDIVRKPQLTTPLNPASNITSTLGTKPKTEGYGRALEKKRDTRDRFSLYKEPNHGILQNLTKGPREILVLEELGKMSVKPPKMVLKARDTSKYCEFHQDYGHDTNSCRELKNQIDKAGKSGKLAHFIKGIRKGMAKQTATKLGRVASNRLLKLRERLQRKEEHPDGLGVVNTHQHYKALQIHKCREVDISLMNELIQFIKLLKEVSERRKEVYTMLLGFSNEQVNPLG
ncbi:hypothetical protein Tco_1017767 [Tanacetum coccineum]|uniref:Reverse transcriptase domain-containing protein n=1 Tax=Tanacetum coccineum TaxID=301880 RepID=A0ABQ5FSE5_9ASTR